MRPNCRMSAQPSSCAKGLRFPVILTGWLIFQGSGLPTLAQEPAPAPSTSPAQTDAPAPNSLSEESAPAPKEAPPIPLRQAIPRAGDTVQFIFTSGDSSEARISEVRDDGYRAVIGGLEVFVARSDLDDIIVLPSIEERFRQMRDLIEPDDVDSMSALASWAFERGLNEQALQVVGEALTYEAQNTKLQTLRDMLRAQIAMDKVRAERKARAVEDGAEVAEPDDESVHVPRPWPDFPLLTEAQVNLLKVYEVNLHRPPRIIIERPTIDALLQNYATNPLIPTTREARDAFRRRLPAEILDVMYRVRARDLYPEVRVVGQPESMREFRDSVHAGWLINNCATNRCHGGEDARELILFNRKPTASRSVYTNFLILERYRTDDGRPLIDYQAPDRSMLLQMGLPREDAITPHPDVVGWTPVFRSRDSRAFQRAVRWIQLMYRPRPDYPIDYTPPGSASARSPDEPEADPVER